MANGFVLLLSPVGVRTVTVTSYTVRGSWDSTRTKPSAAVCVAAQTPAVYVAAVVVTVTVLSWQ